MTEAKSEEPLLLSIPTVAVRLACGRSKVYELLDSGELQSVKIGRLRRITPASVNRYVEKLVEQAS